MTFNFRLMKRYDNNNPVNYWYEIVEIFYGEDKVPMFWGELSMPMVDSIQIQEDVIEGDNEHNYVVQEIANEWALIAKDIKRGGHVYDQFDFEPGGKYYGHEEAQEMNQYMEAIKSGDPDALADLGLTTVDSKDFIKRLMKDDDEEGKE